MAEECHYWVCPTSPLHLARWATIYYYSTKWHPRLASVERSCRGFAHSCRIERNRCIYSGWRESNVVTVTSGVPQGSVLVPLFFILYTADISLITKAFNLKVHCYADDGQLYFHERVSSVVAKFSACIAEMERWMASKRRKLNPSKTQFIWMGTWQQLAKVDSRLLALGSSTLECQSTVSNLGVTIDSQLTMKDSVSFVDRSHPMHAHHLYMHSFQAGWITATICSQASQTLSLGSYSQCCVSRKYDPISKIIRDQLYWVSVRQQIDFKLGVLVCKCLHIAQWGSSLSDGDGATHVTHSRAAYASFICSRRFCCAEDR